MPVQKTLCRCIVITNNNSIRFQRFLWDYLKKCRKNEREGKYAEGIVVVVDMQNDFFYLMELLEQKKQLPLYLA